MIGLDNLNPEYKSSVLFALTAFIVAMIAGIIGGLDVVVVIIRMVLSAVIFALIGYGVVLIIKNYVPEIYEILNSFGEAKPEGEPEEMDFGESTAAGEETGIPGESAPAAEFTEYRESDFEHIDESLAPGSAKSSSSGAGLGKHIVVNEKFGKYEPRVMAQAVRTMMRKDEE